MSEALQLGTDKMQALKENGVGWMIFNNPEKHNAVSFEMWQAAEAILDKLVREIAAMPQRRPLLAESPPP